jgi:phage tail tape-measure protein
MDAKGDAAGSDAGSTAFSAAACRQTESSNTVSMIRSMVFSLLGLGRLRLY